MAVSAPKCAWCGGEMAWGETSPFCSRECSESADDQLEYIQRYGTNCIMCGEPTDGDQYCSDECFRDDDPSAEASR